MEKTGPQSGSRNLVILPGTSVLGAETGSKLTTARRTELLKDPTVSLGRAFTAAPVLVAGWSLFSEEAVPKERIDFIQNQILPWRIPFLQHAMFSRVDYGWAPFEVVYDLNNGKVVLKKLKPLLQGLTEILVDGSTGEHVGFRQGTIVLEKRNSLLVSFDVEGTNWYGRALLESVVASFYAWNAANAGAERYDRKIAGSHFVVHYPPGTTLVDGVPTANESVATILLAALEASGSVAVPSTVLEHIEEMNKDQAELYGWKIEILEDKGGRQPTFISRLKYLDTLKVRGLQMPERSLMEGTHGTLAEASAHIDLALTNMDFVHALAVWCLNMQVVNTLLEQNYGPDTVNSIRLIPNSLLDQRKSYLQNVFMSLVQKSQGESIGNLDLGALMEMIGVPSTGEVVTTKKEEPI